VTDVYRLMTPEELCAEIQRRAERKMQAALEAFEREQAERRAIEEAWMERDLAGATLH
jgi:hypothetical protein